MLRNIQQYVYLPLLLVCISSLGLVCSVIAQEKAAPPIRPTVDYSLIIAKLKEQLPQQMTQMNVPGLAIALVDGATLVWAEGFGVTDRASQTKVTADTLFSVQSISKTYTATGFLIAVEKGLMKLDDPLKKYYPEFTVNSRFGADEANRITFRHLLSHWSGLTHMAPCGKHFYRRGCSYVDHIRSISETWLKFPVGERYSYSNLGIDLVGYALELRSGKPFDEFMNEELFRPLGMTSSAFNRKVAAKDTKLLQRFAGTYQLREELLLPFKVKEDGLYVVSGTNEVRLNAHSPTEFSFRGSKFTFILNEKGRPKGVQVVSSGGSDSNVEFLPFNDKPDEEAGPNKKEWQDFVGEYSRESDGDTFSVSVIIKNGYLYLDRLGGLKLNEYKPGVFFTADGEAVIFQGARMSLYNYGYTKKSAPKVEYKVAAETLKIYEGVYKNEEVEVTFKIKEGKLVGGPVGEELALIPVGKHTFEVDGMAGATCVFNLEADKVAGLMVKGLSRQVELKKVEAK